MVTAKRFIVKGKVQGVGYRFFTCTCADALGVRGWVMNRADGTVEVHAEGSDEQLREFEFDLQRGARYARVESVESEPATVETFDGFRMRR